MAISYDTYGSLAGADEYFAHRLHEFAWTAALPADRQKALLAATQIIEALNFKGRKHTVAVLFAANENATTAEIQAAEALQALEFPRGTDTEVPEAIERACYEIAHSLLDGKDPERELESLAVTGNTYGAVKTTYERGQLPIEHLINLVPSSVAWRLLKPFLRDSDAIKLSRIS